MTGESVDLVFALQRAAEGILDYFPPASVALLSPRERQVLQAIACGWDNKRIAAALHLESQTILNIVTRTMIADFEDFVTWMFVTVDDCWQHIGSLYRRSGPEPSSCSDSELIRIGKRVS